jgi:multiple sugar transport system substrate-binding protein
VPTRGGLSPALEKRFQWLVDFARVEKVAKPLEASGGTFPDIDAFTVSQAAMFINGTWDLLHEQQSIGAHNLGVAVIPSDNGQPHGSIAGTGFAVTKSCGDKKAAFAAIAAMTSSKSQQSVAKSRSQVPSRADSLGAWQSSVGPEAAAVVKVLTANGRVGVAATNGDKINTLFNQYEVDGFSGKSTAAEVLKAVSAGLGQ